MSVTIQNTARQVEHFKGYRPTESSIAPCQRSCSEVPMECPLLSVSLIKLTQSKYAIVDTADYEWLNEWRWHVGKHGSRWVAMRTPARNIPHHTIFMAREILAITTCLEVDHINHNTLDNRRSNLRPVSHKQNMCNRQKNKTNTTGFKGVSRKGNRWRATIMTSGKIYRLGYYKTSTEAAVAYNNAARKYHGIYAHLNIIN
jgi:hypothetical protein